MWDDPEIISLLTLCACHCSNFKVMVKRHDDVETHSYSSHQYSEGVGLGRNSSQVDFAVADLGGPAPSYCQRVPGKGTSRVQYFVSHLQAVE